MDGQVKDTLSPCLGIGSNFLKGSVAILISDSMIVAILISDSMIVVLLVVIFPDESCEDDQARKVLL